MRRTWVLLLVAGCGGSSESTPPRDAKPVDAVPDIAIDAPEQLPVDEPPDCGGDPLIARQGDLAMVVSAFAIDAQSAAYDLNGDGQPDNKMSAVASISQDAIADGLAMGTFVVPIEVFDRDPDPDACLKLATYRGTCAGCDLTDATIDTITLDPTSLGTNNDPTSRLRSMSTSAAGAITSLPGYLEIDTPITDQMTLRLPISVHRARGTLQGTSLSTFHVGGTLRAARLDSIAAPDVEQIALTHDDTLLDAFFANLLGPLLALPKSTIMPDCRTMDVDIDKDGLEAFCDTTPGDPTRRIDLCIDGDGTIIRDGDAGIAQCSQATVGGVPRFADGISISVTFDTKPATIAP